MKKLWILSIFVLAMACLLAVGASAVDYQADITTTGLAVNGTDRSSAGTYKAGNGTVEVSFVESSGSVTCYITIDNATIDTKSSGGYAIYSPYPTIVTITGSNHFYGVDAIKVEGGSITLKGSSVTGGSFLADSIILEGSSTLDAVIINFDEGNLAVSAGSTVSGLLAARHDYGGSGGFYNTIKCVGNVVNAEGAVIEVSLLSINDFTFEAGATLTLNGELRNGYSGFDPEEMKAWAERVKNHLSGSGLIQIGIIGSYAFYTTDGEQIPGALELDDENGGGKTWSWNASTKTLTLKNGFRCMEDIDICVGGDITVIVEGDAYVGDDFRTADEGITATVTIKGPGTLTVHDEFEMSDDSRLSLIIAEGTTVIAEEEVDLYSLTVNGTFEVNDSSTPLIDIQGGTLTVSQTGKLLVNNTDPAPGDIAIQFSDITSPNGLCNIAGTTVIPAGKGVFILADENGTPFKDFHTDIIVPPKKAEATSGVNAPLLIVLMKHAAQQYTVTLTASEGGSITGDEVVRWSRSAVYTITPDEGWTLVSLYLDGKEIKPTLTLKLNRVRADHTIVAVFAPIKG